MTRPQLDELCTRAKCTILSKASTAHLDAYVLSESSLFVYEHRLIMKTCGTTTLLRCLSTLFEFSDKLQMQLSWVGYSRKNFLFPTRQLWPHVNFGEEMRYIDQHETLHNRLRGDGHILGPVTGDHWFVYVADGSPLPSQAASPVSPIVATPLSISPIAMTIPARDSTDDLLNEMRAVSPMSDTCFDSSDVTSSEGEEEKAVRSRGESFHQNKNLANTLAVLRPVPHHPNAFPGTGNQAPQLAITTTRESSDYRTFNMMMFDMDPAVASTFYQSVNGFSAKEMSQHAGIKALCPGAHIDAAAFTPCGYSMNAVLDSSYSTIHVTPEAQCSYASFETNTPLEDYAPLVKTVLATFRPQRFVLTMFGDDCAIDRLDRLPTDNRTYGDIKHLPGAFYQRSSATCTTVESQRQHCVMACYSLQNQAALSE